MKIRWDTPRVAGCVLLAALAGCAQTTVQPVREALDVTMPRPQTVLVYKFAVNMAEVQENQGIFQKAINAAESTTQDEQTREIARDVSNRLADELVVRITELGLPAQRATWLRFVDEYSGAALGTVVFPLPNLRRSAGRPGRQCRASALRVLGPARLAACGQRHPLGQLE